MAMSLTQSYAREEVIQEFGDHTCSSPEGFALAQGVEVKTGPQFNI